MRINVLSVECGLVIENRVRTEYINVFAVNHHITSQYGTPAEPLHHVPASPVVLSGLETAFLARWILSFLKME